MPACLWFVSFGDVGVSVLDVWDGPRLCGGRAVRDGPRRCVGVAHCGGFLGGLCGGVWLGSVVSHRGRADIKRQPGRGHTLCSVAYDVAVSTCSAWQVWLNVGLKIARCGRVGWQCGCWLVDGGA